MSKYMQQIKQSTTCSWSDEKKLQQVSSNLKPLPNWIKHLQTYSDINPLLSEKLVSLLVKHSHLFLHHTQLRWT